MQFGSISNAEYTSVKVGQPLPFFQGGFEVHRGQDFGVFEVVEGGQLILLLYLAGMTEQEQMVLRKTKARMRVVRDGVFVQTLIRFMGTSLIFEMSHDPTLYDDRRSLRIGKETNLINVIGVDSNTNIVKTIRSANLPRRLCEILQFAWPKAFEEEKFSPRYTSWCNYLAQHYNVLQMWERGVDVGPLGE